MIVPSLTFDQALRNPDREIRPLPLPNPELYGRIGMCSRELSLQFDEVIVRHEAICNAILRLSAEQEDPMVKDLLTFLRTHGIQIGYIGIGLVPAADPSDGEQGGVVVAIFRWDDSSKEPEDSEILRFLKQRIEAMYAVPVEVRWDGRVTLCEGQISKKATE